MNDRPNGAVFTTASETEALKAAGQAIWDAMAALVRASPHYASRSVAERHVATAHLCQQAIRFAVVGAVGKDAPLVILGGCGLIVGEVIAQAPSPAYVAAARSYLDDKIAAGARDFQHLTMPRGNA